MPSSSTLTSTQALILLPSMAPSPPSSTRKLRKLLPFLLLPSLIILVLSDINAIPYHFSSQPTSRLICIPQPPPTTFLFNRSEHPLQEPPQTPPQSPDLSNSNGYSIHQSPPTSQSSILSPPSIPTAPPIQRPKPSRSMAPIGGVLKSLWPTPKSTLFSIRAQRFFTGNSSCKARFFMTWFSAVDSFTARELLAVESLFKAQNDACLLILSATLDSPEGQRILQPFKDRGFKVAALSPDYLFLLRGTPAEGWFRRLVGGHVSHGRISLGQNLSNLLRLAALYRYGGTYLDADVIVMRSLGDLRNVVGAQSADAGGNWTTLNNAVMAFDRGHPLVLEFMREYAKTFDGSRWGHNGPYLVTRVMRRRVAVEGVRVVGPQAFYPVNWLGIAGWFRKPRDERGRRWVEEKATRLRDGNTYVVHLWNRESKGLTVEEGSLIQRILRDRCLLCNYSY